VLLQTVLALLYGLCAAGIHDRKQDDVNQLYFASWLLLGNMMFHSPAAVMGNIERWPPFKGELTAGMYEPGMYWLVSTLLDMIVNIVATAGGVVPLILFMNVPANSYFGLICTVWAAAVYCSAFIDFFCIYGFDAAAVGQAQWSFQCIYAAGIFFDGDTIIWPLRIFYYITPFRYAWSSILQLTYGDEHDEWHGAYRLSSAPQEIRDSPAGLDALSNGAIFVCPDSDVCFGDNGRDVKIGLAAIHSAASTIAGFSWGVNFLVIMAMVLAVRLIGVAALKQHMKSRDQLTAGTVTAASSVTEHSKLLA